MTTKTPPSSSSTGRIAAVPQTYAGVRFRSTLEADWAATLDSVGIRWQYEPEAVALPSGALYRPDFYLPDCATWLEVKGPHDERLDKTRELASSVAHNPHCPGWSEPAATVEVRAATGEQLAAVGAILDAAPDGPTEVTVRHAQRVRVADDPAGRRAWRDETFAVHRPRRRFLLDCATVRRFGDLTADTQWKVSAHPYVQCPTNDPWQLVMIGRASENGVAVWEEATGSYELQIVQCASCGKSAPFESHMGWFCRQCGARGEVWRDGPRPGRMWCSPRHTSWSSELLPFVRAPRGQR